MNSEQGIVLVVGGTGKLGGHIIRELVDKGNKVRLIARTRKSAVERLGSDLINGLLENVIECDLASESKV